MSGNAWDYSYGGALDENHTVRDGIESTDQTSSPLVDISALPYVVNAFVEEAAFSGCKFNFSLTFRNVQNSQKISSDFYRNRCFPEDSKLSSHEV